MTERAKRLGEYLEKCGWSIFNNYKTSAKCECGSSVDTKYCPDCGRRNDVIDEPVLEQMESAIKYALGEKYIL